MKAKTRRRKTTRRARKADGPMVIDNDPVEFGRHLEGIARGEVVVRASSRKKPSRRREVDVALAAVMTAIEPFDAEDAERILNAVSLLASLKSYRKRGR